MKDSIIDNIHINFDADALWVLNMALALVMFGIALNISIHDFKAIFKSPKSLLIGICSQFLVLPAVTFLLVRCITPIPSIALGMIMVAACPGGNVSNFITHLAKGNSALSISLTAFATLFAVVLTPVNLQFWGGLYAPTALILQEVAIAPIEMIKLVSLLLGIPLLLGMLVNHFAPKMAVRLAKILKVVSLVFFISLVFIALYNNRGIFMEYVFYVFWIVLAHNILAFSTGFSLAKFFKLNTEDTKAITIETGIQNSGLGLLLIFTFFDGLGGMALLAAFWGIWHLVSGMLLASFWNRVAATKEELV